MISDAFRKKIEDRYNIRVSEYVLYLPTDKEAYSIFAEDGATLLGSVVSDGTEFSEKEFDDKVGGIQVSLLCHRCGKKIKRRIKDKNREELLNHCNSSGGLCLSLYSHLEGA